MPMPLETRNDISFSEFVLGHIKEMNEIRLSRAQRRLFNRLIHIEVQEKDEEKGSLFKWKE